MLANRLTVILENYPIKQKHMKKTEYFLVQVAWNQPQTGIEQVIKKRDAFIEKNKASIGKIDEEDIKIEYMQGANQTLFVIKLTYFPK